VSDSSKGRRTPWRDNIEAMTVAVIMAVVLKYFIVEAYKIPTGSMQPTLMGNEETGIFDRILVDKLSYHFRDPLRWEVAVFKYPLDRSKNFVKRIVGMPGEMLRILHGDLWTRLDENSPWKILRRPRAVQREMWKALDLTEDGEGSLWSVENQTRGSWSFAAHEIQARGDGRARFGGPGSIMDQYNHGYPRKMQGKILVRPNTGRNAVGDLRVEGEVRAQPGCRLVAVELEEGARRYSLELPGPAAASDARPRLAWIDGQSAGSPTHEVFGEPYRLRANTWVRFGGQNLDDELSLDVGGEVVCSMDIDPSADQRSAAFLRVEGEGADFRELQAERDVYYTEARLSEATIAPGHYFMMGDNTQDSSDSREWTLAVLKWSGPGSEGQPVRGNNRYGENPVTQNTFEDPMTWFRDEWGELHTFPSATSEVLEPIQAPLVPRELITGRALLVFWPISPGLRLWRLKWVH
jgi:signal peptidase I